MEASGSADATKVNLPLLRAVKDGKIPLISKLLDDGEVDVNFQNRMRQRHPRHRRGVRVRPAAPPLPALTRVCVLRVLLLRRLR